VTIKPVKVR